MRRLAAPLLLALLCACQRSAPAPETPPPHGTFTMESQEIGETRVINVYTPPGYAEDTDARYPVLYMPDGGVGEDFPHIANTLDAGIRAGEITPLVLVGIENTERRRDMTGPTQVEKDREVAPVTGGSAAFRAFIARELMPRIRADYRVTADEGIIGESAAGLFIMETFFLEPQLFDRVIAISPALWWNDHELVRRAEERFAAGGFEGVRLVLTSADETDIAPYTAELGEVLERAAPPGLRWSFTPRTDLKHATIYRAVAPGILRDVYGPSKP
ncbi:MAG TPA: alpha/beta hydrolase-fold protein [Candidatus Krumholzibacteria bacterium]|mgnify:CR=1 FL=1|nr:alpha/beta hydrolase-fold protein [Candidatus Krumholzibacteria bacterium]HRX52605.1 alpha/beta hydrolase-fold protein [Candidatus Krumholzibacteria bacterium]